MCLRNLEQLDSIAPKKELSYCQTEKGARWEAVIEAFKSYFDLQENCRSVSDLKLNGLEVTIGQLMGAMTQLMKQLMTNYVGKGDPELVKAMIKFNEQSDILEADSRCMFTYDKDSGLFDGVIFKLSLKPEHKFTNRTLPSHYQIEKGVLNSLTRRSSDCLMLRVPRTKRKGPVAP